MASKLLIKNIIPKRKKMKLDENNEFKAESQLMEAFHRLCKRPVALISMCAVGLLFLIAIFADLIVPYESATLQVAANKLMTPCSAHIFGCDEFGRDIFARIIHGTRVAVCIGMSSSLIGLFFAIILACLAAVKGGIVDMIIMRIVDVISSIPGIVISLAICAALGNGIWQLVIALAFASIPGNTKMVRSKSLTVAKMEYIESAYAVGAKQWYMILRHMIPNLVSIIIVNGTSQISINILQAASLGFIGLGIKPPTPEWGTMLSNGLVYMLRTPHMVNIPGFALIYASLSINTFGDCLRDALDPQLKGKA